MLSGHPVPSPLPLRRNQTMLDELRTRPTHRPGDRHLRRVEASAATGWSQGVKAWASILKENGLERERTPKPMASGFSTSKFWRRPTLPGGLPPSTIGAVELNFRVRDGNGCDIDAMATRNQLSTRVSTRTPEQARALFKLSPRPISTGRLNALPHLHLRPINVVVYPRALPA
jgi:hypothetical protein